jgi:D-serine deaminase-like pyridoxal phosphate-dependent protein
MKDNKREKEERSLSILEERRGKRMISNSLISSPALLCEERLLRQNIEHMQARCKEHGVLLRPMVKTHKCAEIIRMQMEAGAIGVLVANAKEAFLARSVACRDITLAYPLVQKELFPFYQDLSKEVELTFTVDSMEHLGFLKECFAGLGGSAGLAGFTGFAGRKTVKVLIKIDSGLHRLGVLPEDVASLEKLTKAIVALPFLDLCGVGTHAGQVYASQTFEEVKRIAMIEQEAVRKAAEVVGSFAPLSTLAIGSTPTVLGADGFEGISEVRPGNYVFYDLTQVKLGVASLEQCALKVKASVLSRPSPHRAIIDTGSKQLGLDKGAHSSQMLRSYGYVLEEPEADLYTLSEELGWLKVLPQSTLKAGDELHIIPNHACVTASCYRSLNVVDDHGDLADSWKIASGN